MTPPPDVTDPDPANNVATDTTEIDQQANLEIVKTGPAAVVAGQTIAYTITVLNAGPSTATDVVVDDPPPADLDLHLEQRRLYDGVPLRAGDAGAGRPACDHVDRIPCCPAAAWRVSRSTRRP